MAAVALDKISSKMKKKTKKSDFSLYTEASISSFALFEASTSGIQTKKSPLIYGIVFSGQLGWHSVFLLSANRKPSSQGVHIFEFLSLVMHRHLLSSDDLFKHSHLLLTAVRLFEQGTQTLSTAIVLSLHDTHLLFL